MEYPNIQVSKGMAGWFAVKLWWNPGVGDDAGGFAEPDETGVGRYAYQADAIKEALDWASVEGIPYYPPKVLDFEPARQDVNQQMIEMGFTPVHEEGTVIYEKNNDM